MPRVLRSIATLFTLTESFVDMFPSSARRSGAREEAEQKHHGLARLACIVS